MEWRENHNQNKHRQLKIDDAFSRRHRFERYLIFEQRWVITCVSIFFSALFFLSVLFHLLGMQRNENSCRSLITYYVLLQLPGQKTGV